MISDKNIQKAQDSVLDLMKYSSIKDKKNNTEKFINTKKYMEEVINNE